MMNATPTPPESPTTLQVVLAAVPSWVPWGLGLLVVAAIAWWVLPRLIRSGLPQKAARMVAGRLREALVKQAAPAAPPAVSPEAPPVRPAEAAAPTPPPASGDSPRSVKATIAIASLPSLASLVWTAWSLIDMIDAPLPVGLAAGVVLDIAMVSAIAIAWINISVAPGAKKFGWFVASIATVLVGWHAYEIMPILAILGIIPLVATGLWHFALNARIARAEKKDALEAARLAKEAEEAEAKRAAEEEAAAREAELSAELSHERRAELARLEEDATYIEEKAERELRVAEAKAKAEHEKKVANVRRLGEEQRAMDEEAAKVEMARQELIQKVNASRPASFALPAGDVPSDLSSLPPSPSASLMGFGAVMGSDLGVSGGRPGGVPSGIDPDLKELLTYIASAGEDASVRGASRELGVAPATIRRRRDRAEEAGLDMSALKRTT